jgi:hypothetical protein
VPWRLGANSNEMPLDAFSRPGVGVGFMLIDSSGCETDNSRPSSQLRK